MRSRVLQFQSLFLLAQHALRAAPKPRPQSQLHRRRLLHCPNPSAPAPVSPSPWIHLLCGLHPGTAIAAASFLQRGAAAAARTAASRWLAAARGAGSRDLFSLQRRPVFSAATFFRGAPWAHWMESAEGAVWMMLIGANLAVFMLWRVADPEFMRRHFMISLDNFRSGRLHTFLTSAFSHQDGTHLVNNMIGLYFFGRNIASAFGSAFLLKLYVAGALTGSAFFLLERAFLAPRKQGFVGWDTSRAPGLVASAEVNATILLHIFLHPKGLVYLYFVIPIPAAVVGAAFIGLDLLRANKEQGHVSGSAPLGGALVAALVWARIRKGWI